MAKTQKPSVPSTRKQLAAEALPRRPLSETVEVAKVLHATYAGKGASWDEIADALGMARVSNKTKYLFWSAQAYGLTLQRTILLRIMVEICEQRAFLRAFSILKG